MIDTTRENLARCLIRTLEYLDNAIVEAANAQRAMPMRHKWQECIEADAILDFAEDLQGEIAGHLLNREVSERPYESEALLAELRTIAGPDPEDEEDSPLGNEPGKMR